MSDENTQPQSPPRSGRRSSFAGQTFADLFSAGGSRPSVARGSSDAPMPASPPPQQQPVGPISKAAQQAQQRRLSLTTLGLSGSSNQSTPFSGFRSRGESIGSANSGSIDESAIAEDEAPREQNSGSSPTNTPFARRTSFGARALGQIRSGSFSGQGGGSPGSPGQNGTNSPPSSEDAPFSKKNAQKSGTISPPNSKGRGSSEGFNWSDNLRSRAERTSIAGQGGMSGPGGLSQAFGGKDHSRAKSVATMEPPPVAPPKPKEKPKPDHFQERILKGDFYMD